MTRRAARVSVRHRSPGSPGARKSPTGAPHHVSDAISSVRRQRHSVVRGQSSGSPPTSVAPARTNGRSRPAARPGRLPPPRAANHRGAAPALLRGGPASSSRHAAPRSSPPQLSSSSASSTTIVPSRSRSPKRSCRAAYSSSSSSVIPVTSAMIVEPGSSRGLGPEMSSRRSKRPASAQRDCSEPFQVAAFRYEVELDPGALQLGEHHVRIVVGEERTRQIDFHVVVDGAGVDGPFELFRRG